MKNSLFLLIAVMIFTAGAKAQDPLWVRDNTWYFDNFKQAELGWDLFRETFNGVAPSPSGDFDLLFYETLYKTELAKSGHCYGMDVLALMILKNGGHLGYCHPPYIYTAESPSPADETVGPADATLRRAIQIMHGYQISHGFLSFLLDVIAKSKNRDGNYAFQQVEFYAAKNDPTIISISKTLNPADGAHVVVPFFTKNMGGTKRIYVYDPNRSYYEAGAAGHDYYHGLTNYIEITGSGNWSYTMADGTVYSGGLSSGGNCIAVPISVAGRKDRLPQSLLADGAYTINTIFIFSDNAKVKQIADVANHRRYLNQEGTELESRKERALNNILPFIPQGGNVFNTSISPQVYFVRGNRPLDVAISARGDYSVGMLFGGKYKLIRVTGDGSVQHFHTPDLSTPKPEQKKILLPSKRLLKSSLINLSDN